MEDVSFLLVYRCIVQQVQRKWFRDSVLPQLKMSANHRAAQLAVIKYSAVMFYASVSSSKEFVFVTLSKETTKNSIFLPPFCWWLDCWGKVSLYIVQRNCIVEWRVHACGPTWSSSQHPCFLMETHSNMEEEHANSTKKDSENWNLSNLGIWTEDLLPCCKTLCHRAAELVPSISKVRVLVGTMTLVEVSL